MGIGSIIYPEMLAGQEILHNIKRSWIRQWWEVQDGALILLGVKVRSNAQILDQPLKTFAAPNRPITLWRLNVATTPSYPMAATACAHLMWFTS